MTTLQVTRSLAPLSPPPPRRRRALVAGWTLPLCALGMMVSSDYKFRIRPLGQSLSATPDLNTLAEIFLYLVVFLVVGRVVVSTRAARSPATPLMFFTWVYSAYMCCSVAWAVYPPLAAVRGWQFIVTAGLAAAIYRYGTRLDMHRLAHWYICTAAGSVVFGMVFHFPRLRLMVHRFNWLYVHPVIAGTWLGLAVVITLWLLLTRQERAGLPMLPTWVYWGILTLVAGGLVGTQTRGAIGGCAAGSATLLMVRYRRRLPELVAFGAVALVTIGLLFLNTILVFLARGESSQELTSFNGRTPLWDQAYHLVLAQPVIGYGTTASRGLFWDNVALGGAHNAAINVVVDGGLLGLTLWFSIIVCIVRLVRPLLRHSAGRVDGPLIAAALTYLFVNGFTTEGLGYVGNVSSLWLFVLVGWTGLLYRPVRSPHPRRPAHAAPPRPFPTS